MYRKGILPLLLLCSVWSWECSTDHNYLDVPKNALLQAAYPDSLIARNEDWAGIRIHIEPLDLSLPDQLMQELTSSLIPHVSEMYSFSLMVKPLSQNLVISPEACNYGIPSFHRTSGLPVDLIIYMRAKTEVSETWTARAKICQIQDGDVQAPLAGMFEIDTSQYSLLTKEDREELILHEIAHVLGLPNLIHSKHSNCAFRHSSHEEVGTAPYLLKLSDEQGKCDRNYVYSEVEERCIVIECDDACEECDRYDHMKCNKKKECKHYFKEYEIYAHFEKELEEIHIELDKPAQILQKLECEGLIVEQDLEQLGKNPRCIVNSNKRLQIQLGQGASIINKTISLKPDLLYSLEGECSEPSPLQISLHISGDIPKPEAVITSPLLFSTVCGDERLVISGLNSKNELTKGLFYSWELKQDNNSDLPSFSNFSKEQATISIPTEKLRDTELEVKLWVKNEFGGIDACTQIIYILSTPAPIISIQMPNILDQFIQESDIKAVVENDCELSPNLHLSWVLKEGPIMREIKGDSIKIPHTSLSLYSFSSLNLNWKSRNSSGSLPIPSNYLNPTSEESVPSETTDSSIPFTMLSNNAIFAQAAAPATPTTETDEGDDCDDNLGPIWVMLSWTVFMGILTLIAFFISMPRKKDKQVYSPLPPGTERRERELEVREQGDHRIVEVVERERRVVEEHWRFYQKFWQYHLTFGICNRYDRHPALRLLTLTTIIMVEFCIFGILYWALGDPSFEGDDEDDIYEGYGDDIAYIFIAVGITFLYLLIMMTLLAIFDHLHKRGLPMLIGLLLTVPLLAAAIVGICLLDAMKFCGRAENEWSMSILWIFLIEVLIMESIVALLFTFVSCCRKSGKRRRAKKAEKRQSREMARA